ncbi:hypothetical protein BDR04DRAFT_1093758 [Suillus decipiens]|nr:hypothetical protein BDR04DRAFT_1093758 [Suillus decipiens]
MGLYDTSLEIWIQISKLGHLYNTKATSSVRRAALIFIVISTFQTDTPRRPAIHPNPRRVSSSARTPCSSSRTLPPFPIHQR